MTQALTRQWDRNFVPLPYSQVSVQPYAGATTEDAIVAHLRGHSPDVNHALHQAYDDLRADLALSREHTKPRRCGVTMILDRSAQE